MASIRFLMIGGFLGAGKTTAIGRLARHYMDQGKKVGIITNDQAQDLVDTHTLREQGFPVEEVAGACFFCKFDDLMDKVGNLQRDQQPDVVIAEPVGSCTDLIATVVQPLKDLFKAQFSVAPYPVLFKPSHGLKILRGEKGGFSPKAEYIFRKQMEEADALVINRIDEMTQPEIDELTRLVHAQYPGVPVLRISAKTGAGLETLTQLLDQHGKFGGKILDIDYDIYAEGEAELGWLNSSQRVKSTKEFALDTLLLDVVAGLQESLKKVEGAEVAHLKAIGLWEGFFGVANLVSSGGKAELSLPSRCQVKEADLIVNARVAMDPAELTKHVDGVVEAVTRRLGGELSAGKTQSFRPGRPTPTHRYAAAK